MINNTNIPIFVINLKKNIEKKIHMKKLCQKYLLSCHFINAIYGKGLSQKFVTQVYSSKQAMNDFGRELTRGEIGCTLTHFSVYKKIIDENIPFTIVFEDDIVFDESIKTFISLIDKLPKDAELLLLGERASHITNAETPSSFWFRRNIGNGFKIVRLIQKSYSGYGYLISLNGAKKLITYSKSISKPIDHYNGDDQYVNVYALRPRVLFPDAYYDKQSDLSMERDMQEVLSQKPLTSKNILFEALKYFLNKIGLYRHIKKIILQCKLPKKYGLYE